MEVAPSGEVVLVTSPGWTVNVRRMRPDGLRASTDQGFGGSADAGMVVDKWPGAAAAAVPLTTIVRSRSVPFSTLISASNAGLPSGVGKNEPHPRTRNPMSRRLARVTC
jgi:hypothetical protein